LNDWLRRIRGGVVVALARMGRERELLDAGRDLADGGLTGGEAEERLGGRD
jgi:hypothetical protein